MSLKIYKVHCKDEATTLPEAIARERDRAVSSINYQKQKFDRIKFDSSSEKSSLLKYFDLAFDSVKKNPTEQDLRKVDSEKKYINSKYNWFSNEPTPGDQAAWLIEIALNDVIHFIKWYLR